MTQRDRQSDTHTHVDSLEHLVDQHQVVIDLLDVLLPLLDQGLIHVLGLESEQQQAMSSDMIE